MCDFIDYLKIEGFLKCENLRQIKTCEAEHDEKKFWVDRENQLIALHISNCYYDDSLWTQLKIKLEATTYSVKVLYIGSSFLSLFSLESNKFADLEYLHLSDNRKLEYVDLYNFNNLVSLNISNCERLTVLKLKGGFKSLQHLGVYSCCLQKILLPKKLPKLQYFNFSNNKLKDFEFLEFIANPSSTIKIEDLIWVNNDFPETFTNTLNRNDLEALKASFVGVQVTVFRKKMILLGNTQVGKTSLCDILNNTELADGTSTHGVNVSRYELGKNRIVQLYDFGGQDFYHNAHLPFYTMNTNYLLIYGNLQEDKYGTIKAHEIEREDDIFPMDYWLNSVKSNLQIKQEDTNEPNYMVELLEKRGIKLSLLENLRAGTPRRLLNEMDLVKKFGVSDFRSFELREPDGKKLGDAKSHEIRENINQWLTESLKEDRLPKKIKNWGDKLIKEDWEAVSPKTKFTNINEIEFKLLHDSYAIHLCEEKDCIKLPEELNDNVIVNLGVFTKWVYAILNLKLQKEEKGIFDEAKVKEYLQEAKTKAQKQKNTTFDKAEKHVKFILAFLKYYKMIFSIKGSDKYLVPQYLPKPEEKDTTDVVLLQLFDKPFIKYVFEGFYHPQILTAIIAAFFDRDNESKSEINGDIQVAKKRIGDGYQYLIWKNKVILYLNKDTKLNPKDFLLIEFKIEAQKPMLVLSEMGQNSLKDVYQKLKDVITFIEKQLENIDYEKLIKTPNGTYISAKLLKDNNHEGNGNPTDLIYDPKHKYFYRKGDFPLFFDPTYYTMKKVFISYSKYDEDYKNDFKEHLISLQRENLIDTFDDRELELGEKWDAKLRQKIVECDYFVCLVSVKFLNVGYIQEIELPEAFRNSKRLILIIIKPCDWTNFTITWVDESGDKKTEKLGDYNAFDKGNFIGLNPKFETPKGQTIIREYSQTERDYRWLEVTNKLRELIKKNN